ncbi:hypothetical protein Rsub_03566 [Raphidocelis subcapitata]|uniref:glutathione-specific gamma-glutamylcyclotransferase n=1 Tax=Raphidocelis subcapitata TaxID=307507 RepID=A0A2V0NUE4_9CHLO|nr:hypothetical protein Rsub_03566 [Raphidocelis subcapitata]|eukprot:GBF91246.1 hypothetical protein Rsub_03566 [Raphidocelis subcapitata]
MNGPGKPLAPPAGQGQGIFIFGYGSLAHTPGFRYAPRVEGYIEGWRRVWWQGSTDHRGTPEAPGRTVTLTPDPAAKTHGVAFEVAGDSAEVERTVAYLEWREKQYDVRTRVDVKGRGGEVLVAGALCYVASDSPANVNWLGPAPVESIAAQIASASGPSGPNAPYLYKLADVMRSMGVDDPELFALEAAVRRLEAAGGGGAAGAAALAAAAAARAARVLRHGEEGGGGGGKAAGAGAAAVAMEAVARGDVPVAAAAAGEEGCS